MHISSGGVRQELMIGGKIQSPPEKVAARAKVLDYTLERMPKDGKFFGLPGNWEFERALFRERPNCSIVGVEHTKQTIHNYAHRMPGGKPKKITEDIGTKTYSGYKTRKSRVLEIQLGKLMTSRSDSISEAEKNLISERYLEWDAAWIDLCSNLSPASIDIFTLVPYVLKRGIIPVSFTFDAGRESTPWIFEAIEERGGGISGRVVTLMNLLTMNKNISIMDTKWFDYWSPNKNNPSNGSPMIVLSTLIDTRNQHA